MSQPPGPPGSRIFSLEDRPAPSLYLIGWVATGFGLGLVLIALVSSSSLSPWLAFGGVVAMGIGLAFAAGYQIVARAARPAEAYRGPSPLIIFGIVLALTTIASAGLTFAGVRTTDPVGFLASLAVIGLCYLSVVGVFIVRTGVMRWSEMGWPMWRSGQRPTTAQLLLDAGYALAIIIPVTFTGLIGGGLLAQLLDVRPPPVLPDAETSLEIIAVALAAAVVAPIGEELFFRGFALTAWWRDLGGRSALIRSAAFFGLVHVANIEAATFGEGLAQALIQVAVILPVGLVIGFLFQRRGMAAAITAHVGYNGLLLALFLFVSSSGLTPS